MKGHIWRKHLGALHSYVVLFPHSKLTLEKKDSGNLLSLKMFFISARHDIKSVAKGFIYLLCMTPNRAQFVQLMNTDTEVIVNGQFNVLAHLFKLYGRDLHR